MALRALALTVFLGGTLLLEGCATSFTGDAHFPGGAWGCADRCRTDGLEMDSYVYLGEYSSGCVCRPAGNEPSRASGPASGAAAVGVMMRMRERARQAQQR